MSPEITVRHCQGIQEMDLCVGLQKRVWGEADLEIVPTTIFIVAGQTGGQVLGAFDGADMVGFTFSMPGVRGGTPFFHSHMTAVLEGYRDRGVGRLLKLFQRDDALSRGINEIEWTFDPLEMRNAHFNLDRLGAIARRALRNNYGVTSSPMHRGLPTDRLVAEWHLRSTRVVEVLRGNPPKPRGQLAEIIVPINLTDKTKDTSAEMARTQSRIMSEFESWFARGFTATGTARTQEGFKYILDSQPDGLGGASSTENRG